MTHILCQWTIPVRRQAIYCYQCWLTYWTLRSIFQWNLHQNKVIYVQENEFEKFSAKRWSFFSRFQYVLNVNIQWQWHRDQAFLLGPCRLPWWRHQMETFSALLAVCAGNSPRWIPTQRPVTRSFDVYFDQRPNKWLSEQSWGWWFETLSRPSWRHRNEWNVYDVSCFWWLLTLPLEFFKLLTH